jgi:hypothetical protein
MKYKAPLRIAVSDGGKRIVISLLYRVSLTIQATYSKRLEDLGMNKMHEYFATSVLKLVSIYLATKFSVNDQLIAKPKS